MNSVITGTSPALGQSPSFHSSSYLPKMEASFMRDFTCCGYTLDSLHDLLQHFEEAHAQTSQQPNRGPNFSNTPKTNISQLVTSIPSARVTQGDLSAGQQQNGRTSQGAVNSFANRQPRRGSEAFNRTNLSTVQDLDTLEDMEIDDPAPLPAIAEQQDQPQTVRHDIEPQQSQQQPGQAKGRIPQLNVHIANNMGNQGIRTSTPNTPLTSTQSINLQNNPTVSSVNTPTLGTNPLAQQQFTPDSSVPGTPAEPDSDLTANLLNGLALPLSDSQLAQVTDMQFTNMALGGPSRYDGTIDQPAKRLFSKTGTPLGISQQQLQLALATSQLSDDEITRKLREQALSNTSGFTFQEEHKPFRCPVIGCEKAYKNQNGLKYHKQVRFLLSLSIFILRMLTYLARSPKPTIERERRWHLFYCRSCYQHPISRHSGNGKGEAISV
jgi:transcription factor SFP1